MVDTRAVAHEVQEQFLAAVQRGQQQFRKSQEQFRKGQEQFRKGREAVSTAIRTGNERAKAVRPSIPALPVKGIHLPQVDPAKLRAHAQEFAGQVAATQRHLADRAVQVATPLVADGVAKLSHVVSSLREDRQQDAEPLAPAAAAATDKQPAEAPAEQADEPAKADSQAAKADLQAGTRKAATTPRTKTGPAKTTPAKAKAADSGKPRTTKAKS